MNQTVLTSVAHMSRYVIADKAGFRLGSALGCWEMLPAIAFAVNGALLPAIG